MGWWILWGIVAVAALWVATDLVYSLLIRRGHARWEAEVKRDPDGVRIGCREYTIGSGDTALLLVHGFGDSPAVYQRMAPALAGRGFCCRVVRLPGFATPMAEYRKTSAAQWRAAVGAELRALRQAHSRVVVVAHSLGAAVAVDSLAESPETADGVVLLAPLIGVSNRRSPLLPAWLWHRLFDFTLFFTDRIGVVFRPDVKDPTAELHNDRYVPRLVYRELFALLRRNRARAKTFRTPLLMVLSRNDMVVDNGAAERFYQECPAVMKKLRYTDQAGHVLPIDQGWEGLVDEIGTFIRELTEGRPADGRGGEARFVQPLAE
jgi:carboxylesterase